MSSVPWLELAVLASGLGAIWVGVTRDLEIAWRHAVAVAAASFLCAVGASTTWAVHQGAVWAAPWATWLGLQEDVLSIDALNAPLLPLVALVALVTVLTTVRAKLPRFSLSLTLASNAVLLAAFASRSPWVVVALLSAQAVIPLYEMHVRGGAVRLYAAHMALFVVLLVVGMQLQLAAGDETSWPAIILLAAAVLLRMGIVPFHTWIGALLENAGFGTSIIFLTPMPAAYLALRFVVPHAPDNVLRAIALLSVVTAVYSAGMTLVQADARRFFAFLFLSLASLVLVGMEIGTPIGLTGAMCMSISVTLALTGFGLTLRAIEARRGRISLRHYHGLYEHAPLLAGFFLLTGLASVGFPGTIGFVAAELVIDGAVDDSPLIGAAVVLAAALASIAVLQVYFRCFTGIRHRPTLSLAARGRERLAIAALTILLLAGGLYPRGYVASRYRAAMEIVAARAERFPKPATEPVVKPVHTAAR